MSIYAGVGGVRREITAGGNMPAAYKEETQQVRSDSPVNVPIYNGYNGLGSGEYRTLRLSCKKPSYGTGIASFKYWGGDAGDGRLSVPFFLKANEDGVLSVLNSEGKMLGFVISSDGTVTGFHDTSISGSKSGDLICVLYIF